MGPRERIDFYKKYWLRETMIKKSLRNMHARQ